MIDEPIAELELYGLSRTMIDTLDKNGYVYIRDLPEEEQLGRIHSIGKLRIAQLKRALIRFIEGRPVMTPLEAIGVDLSNKPMPRLTGAKGRLIG